MNNKKSGLVVIITLLSLLIPFFLFNFAAKKDIQKPPTMPFDTAMQLNQFAHILERPDFKLVYDIFKKQYETYKPDSLSIDTAVRIPKIIHIMWLGGRLPLEYETYVTSWRTMHPDWTILFWTDNEKNYDRGSELFVTFDALEKRLKTAKGGETFVVDSRTLAYENKGFYDAAINYGEKSDILKWEIVYRFGGVYVDTDFECLKSVDAYHYLYDFYTGIQPLDTNMVQLGAALYGAIPHHPIMKACVDRIKHNQSIQQIVVKTGPIHFTKMFVQLAGKTGLRDIALPATYFYPCGYEERGTPRDQWCKNESYAVHHWAGSWLKPEAFVRA